MSGAASSGAAPAAGGAPIAFEGCAGFYHAAQGGVAVLMCSPWGYEELCARASWRQLADSLAQAGFPTLRFDYPGAGDSLGASDAPWRIDDWVTAARRAADVLRDLSGAQDMIFLGQGLGAGVATLAAARLDHVVGLVALAGFSKGRVLAREMGVTAAILADAAGVEPPATGAGLTTLGFTLPASFVDDLKKLDFTTLEAAPAPRLLVVGRFHNQQETDFCARAEKLGVAVERMLYEGYDALVSNPTIAALPETTFSALVTRLANWREQQASPAPAPSKAMGTCGVLEGEAFRETIFRFGAHALLGVYCAPRSARADRVVVFLNCGGNPHSGWRRMTVDHARALAAQGCASLRIDTAMIGDSPAVSDVTDRVYTEQQLADVGAAIDWLETQGVTRTTLVGVCSGAYQALHTALRDPRVDDIVMVNLVVFQWDPSYAIEDFIKLYSRSNAEYFSRLLDRDGLKKLLRGEAPLARLAPVIIGRIAQSLRVRLDAWSRPAHGRRGLTPAETFFAALTARGVRISVVTSRGDISEAELFRHFGANGKRLANFPNVAYARLDHADHNLTTDQAADWLRDHLIARVNSTNL